MGGELACPTNEPKRTPRSNFDPFPLTQVDRDTYVSFMIVPFTTKRTTKTTATAGRPSVRAR